MSETAHSTMTPDAARDRFGDALDGLLSDGERRAFEGALETDTELRQEFEGYRAIVKGVAAAVPHVAGADGEASPGEAAPSLVPRVQDRIRRRSKGRYFRDRFSSGEARGGGLTALLVTAALLLLVAIWLLLDNIAILEP
jgi:anti-sigma factor RsiW